MKASLPDIQVRQLLVHSGLMSYANGNTTNFDTLTITAQGFQFLLEDRQTQSWQLLVYYLDFHSVSSGHQLIMV